MAAPLNPEAFVHWLRQVAPYVHAFRGRTFVVAFGGELFTERTRFLNFVHDLNLLAALGIRLVLVHGARPQIEAELKAKGARSRYAQGLRITDEAALTAVKNAAGVLRIEIEAVLSQGLPSSPMAGAHIRVNSGNFITARPIGVRKGIDFQFTGAVRKVDAAAIHGALDDGEVVLVAHVGYSPTGEVFNLAWEDVAENVAAALRAEKLLMFTDRLPLDRRGQVVSELTAHEAEALMKKGDLTAQTIRAIEHAVRALASGVGRAHLLSAGILNLQGKGEEALAHLESAERAFDRGADAVDRASLRTEQAKAAVQLGNGEEAIARAREALALLEDGDPAEQGAAWRALGEGLALQDEFDSAGDAFGRALRLLAQQERWREAAAVARSWGGILRGLGRQREALEVLEQAADFAARN